MLSLFFKLQNETLMSFNTAKEFYQDIKSRERKRQYVGNDKFIAALFLAYFQRENDFVFHYKKELLDEITIERCKEEVSLNDLAHPYLTRDKLIDIKQPISEYMAAITIKYMFTLSGILEYRLSSTKESCLVNGFFKDDNLRLKPHISAIVLAYLSGWIQGPQEEKEKESNSCNCSLM